MTGPAWSGPRISLTKFIENFILGNLINMPDFSHLIGKNRRINDDSPRPDSKDYKGDILKKFLRDRGKLNYRRGELEDMEIMKAKNGNFQRRLTKDGGRATRANMPFLDPPERPTYIDPHTVTSSEIQFIRQYVGESQKKNEIKAALKQIAAPYEENMSNLPGGVHNAGEETVYQMVNKLEFNPNTTVLLELGSGAPILGVQASVLTKRTICVDVPTVMETVFMIISLMKEEEKSLINTIHLVSCESSFITAI